MTSIVDEDDRIVGVALAVLEGDAPEGTENLRRAETDDGTEIVYRLDPEAEGSADPDAVTDAGEFPDADAARWRASREEVEREASRRDLGDVGRSTAGETGGNR